MEDTDLTRKAIEELMREMGEYKEKESLPTERKKNPLGRPNKRFLGRTINSIMTHNKRNSDRNQQRCQRKLKELDEKQRRRDFRNRRDTRRHSKSESAHEISSASEDKGHTHKKSKHLKKRKKKRRKRKQKSSSSSSSTSSSSDTDSSSSSNTSVESKDKNRKKKRHKNTNEGAECEQDYYNGYGNETGMGYYVDPNVAYAAMAYSQMNHMLQQQQVVQQQMVKEELEESVEIPSDLSISYHSESSLNISLNTSSAEEDENGILTFKLSSDEEAKGNKKATKKTQEINKNNDPHIDSVDSDKDSVQSHISLESETSQNVVLKVCNEIYLLSSSGSDSDDLEIVEVIAEDKSNTVDNESNINEQITENQDIKEVNEVIVTENDENICVIENKSRETDETNEESKDVGESEESKDVVNTNANEDTPKSTSMIDLTDE
ncbi:uncharacterized protein LOC135955057 [Calliphora vicina]|uniref:uncharacterized protein LOC135955057 n=1 Tax=Calliphora vicina TaxID=7373 RepID=UPI00325C0035